MIQPQHWPAVRQEFCRPLPLPSLDSCRDSLSDLAEAASNMGQAFPTSRSLSPESSSDHVSSKQPKHNPSLSPPPPPLWQQPQCSPHLNRRICLAFAFVQAVQSPRLLRAVFRRDRCRRQASRLLPSGRIRGSQLCPQRQRRFRRITAREPQQRSGPLTVVYGAHLPDHIPNDTASLV